MDDERLLAEALRAHAAGGVTPPRPAEESSRDAEQSGSGTLRRRFRPLGRSRREAGATEGGDAARAVPGAPAPGARPATPPGGSGPIPGPVTRPGTGPMPPAGRAGAPARGPQRPGPPGGSAPGGVPRPRAAWTGVATPAGPMPARGPATGTPASGTPAPGRPAAGPPRPDAGVGAARSWTRANVAWWAGVAVLGGGVVGAIAAVATLVLPG